MMHQHPCTDVRERLEAFYDGELAVDERIAFRTISASACRAASPRKSWTHSAARCARCRETADRTSDEPLR